MLRLQALTCVGLHSSRNRLVWPTVRRIAIRINDPILVNPKKARKNVYTANPAKTLACWCARALQQHARGAGDDKARLDAGFIVLLGCARLAGCSQNGCGSIFSTARSCTSLLRQFQRVWPCDEPVNRKRLTING